MKTRHFPGSNLLFDFGAESVEAYAAGEPVLDLREYLSGRLVAAGVFFGLSGRVERRFVADMRGTWDGDKGTLDERFHFADGEVGERRWTLTFAGDGTFVATAPDVEGNAVGRQCGNAAAMRYRLRVPRGNGEIAVDMVDWFYLLHDGTLINKARMSKFGLKVGELVVSFRKTATSAAAGEAAGAVAGAAAGAATES